jgi:hypothetical protein
VHNPYRPPGAAVADVPEAAALDRPRVIKLAIQMLWLAQVLSAVLGLVDLLETASENAYFGVSAIAFGVGVTLSFLVSLWIYGRAYAGRNWARIAIVVLQLLGFAILAWSFAWAFETEGGPSYSAVDILGIVASSGLAVVALVLLFFPDANAWYRAIAARRE